MDYLNLIADKQYFINGSHTDGREGCDIEFLVVHHNAGVKQSTEEVGNFWEGSGTSAHYQVEADGTVGQLVHDRDTAYHAGSWNANLRSIGIEHANIAGPSAEVPWDISDETIKYGGYLAGALCYGYNLGEPSWGFNIFPHSHFSATACPFQLRDRYWEQYIAYATAMYNHLANGGTGEPDGDSVSAPTPAPAPVTKSNAELRDDLATILHGTSDPADLNRRVLALIGASNWGDNNFPFGVGFTQQVVGTEIDGIWGENSEECHDDTVIKVQELLGVDADGIVGPDTTNALTRVINN